MLASTNWWLQVPGNESPINQLDHAYIVIYFPLNSLIVIWTHVEQPFFLWSSIRFLRKPFFPINSVSTFYGLPLFFFQAIEWHPAEIEENAHGNLWHLLLMIKMTACGCKHWMCSNCYLFAYLFQRFFSVFMVENLK